MTAIIISKESFLMQACIKGNRRSQKELYNSLAAKMYLICLRYTKREAAAQVVLQEGFINLFNQLENYDAATPFERWAQRIFVNTAIEYIKEEDVTHRGLNEVRAVQTAALISLYRNNPAVSTNTSNKNNRPVFPLYSIRGNINKGKLSTIKLNVSTAGSKGL